MRDITQKEVIEALETFEADSKGFKAQLVILSQGDWERIRLHFARYTDVMTAPTMPYDIWGVMVYGSYQVHKNEIKII